MSRVALISIGTATPEHDLAQPRATDVAISFSAAPEDHRVIRALYRRSGVQSRGSVLADGSGMIDLYRPDSDPPTTARRMRLYEHHACDLAERACRQAIDRASTPPGSITHLITVSCTGFSAPGVDLELIHRIGLPPTTRRTHIGFMGCHAAINALATAKAYAASDPSARVLVCCVELCSLHFDHTPDAQGHVANALFADGAGAAIVGMSESEPVEIRSTGAVVIPDTADMMSWHIGDHGFRMRLSPAVPATLAKHIPPWLDRWLGESGYARLDIGSWAIHPGGPRVLSALSDALALDPDALAISRSVLSDHGNMSSATLLFILQRLLNDQVPMPLLAAAFGPGLAGEALLLHAGT
ncbi:MAG: type III polyketide synthase [Phycisphaerales bacterium]|nr:type III polyketide synthase [Phycisphaerales bacterium]